MNTMPPIMIPQNPELVMSYDRINQFYEIWSLPAARKYLYRFLKAAHADKAARFRVPSMLYFREELQELINAALCLHRAGAEHPAVILQLQEDAPDISALHQYCNQGYRLKPWHYFPRSLNLQEYINPYKVFRKLAAIGHEQHWKKLLDDLFYYSFSPNSCSDLVNRPNMLQLAACLQKLLEATHLIVVRGINTMEKESHSGNTTDQDESETPEGLKTIQQNTSAAPVATVAEDIQACWEKVNDFFQCWHPQDFEKDLWLITKNALAGTGDDMDANERSTTMLVFEELKSLIPALFTLSRSRAIETRES